VSARCASCEAPVLWAVTATTGSRMPLDPEPRADGTIALIGSADDVEAPLALVLRPSQLREARNHGAPRLYRSHFASCPHAARWRRPRPKEEK
jgi:hypothetical protein